MDGCRPVFSPHVNLPHSAGHGSFFPLYHVAIYFLIPSYRIRTPTSTIARVHELPGLDLVPSSLRRRSHRDMVRFAQPRTGQAAAAAGVLLSLMLMSASLQPVEAAREASTVYLDVAPRPAAAPSAATSEVIGEEKRRVPTGANPLHNRWTRVTSHLFACIFHHDAGFSEFYWLNWSRTYVFSLPFVCFGKINANFLRSYSA